MNGQALGFWRRALKAIATAEQCSSFDPEAAANRAFYAAFHAISALFAIEKKKFSKHSALEAALHRDLINAGRWTKERGFEYSMLLQLRQKGDYGAELVVSSEEAEEAVKAAKNIIQAVRLTSAELDEIS